MAFIGAAGEEKLRARFDQDLQDGVRLGAVRSAARALYVPGREEPQSGRETQQLLQELAALSPQLHLEIHNPRLEPDLAAQYGIERSPALVLLPAPGPDAETGDAETRRRTSLRLPSSASPRLGRERRGRVGSLLWAARRL